MKKFSVCYVHHVPKYTSYSRGDNQVGVHCFHDYMITYLLYPSGFCEI